MVQCSKCSKWHDVPGDVREWFDVMEEDDPWDCSMRSWSKGGKEFCLKASTASHDEWKWRLLERAEGLLETNSTGSATTIADNPPITTGRRKRKPSNRTLDASEVAQREYDTGQAADGARAIEANALAALKRKKDADVNTAPTKAIVPEVPTKTAVPEVPTEAGKKRKRE